MSTPGVGSREGPGLELLVEPSPPSFPLAHTTTTPAWTSCRSRPTITGSLVPQEALRTRIGGHVDAGTPGPHGAAWLFSTQLNALATPSRSVVAEIMTTRAPGALPPTAVLSGKV